MSFSSLKLPWDKPNILPWVILLFAATNVIFLGGKRRAFGSFIAQFHKEYNKTTTLEELNWIGDSYSAFGYMSTGLSIFIITYFNRRYGLFQFLGAVWVLISCLSSAYVPNPHWLFLTHTLFHGIGSSLIISVSGMVVNEHFDKKHRYHLVATTLISGGSVASIIFILFFSYLIQTYNWRHALIILGVLYFLVLGIASIFYKKNPDIVVVTGKKGKPCVECQSSVKIRNVPLIFLWFVDRMMTSIVTYGLLMNLTAYIYKSQHKHKLVKSSLLTILFASGEAVTYLIGAIITAITRNFFKEKLRYILLVTSMTMSACLILLEFYRSQKIPTYLLCFFAGFSLGPSITFLFPAGEEFTRLPGQVAYPISLGGMGFGMLVSPLLTAKIMTTYKDKWFFFVQGCLIFIKVLCLFVIMVILHFWQDKIDNPLGKDENSDINEEDQIHESIINENDPILKATSRKVIY